MAVANPAATPWDFATAMKLGHYSWQNLDTKDQNLNLLHFSQNIIYYTSINMLFEQDIQQTLPLSKWQII